MRSQAMHSLLLPALFRCFITRPGCTIDLCPKNLFLVMHLRLKGSCEARAAVSAELPAAVTISDALSMTVVNAS